MRDFLKELDNINSLSDIVRLSSDTNDGENSFLEFKSIYSDLSGNKEIAEAMSLLAKEMCAFLNSNGGILCWGLKKEGDSKKIEIVNNSNSNLEELFYRKTKDIVSPSFDAVNAKLIKENNKTFLVIAVNSGKNIPYRVESWRDARSDIVKRYFMRSGDKSVEMPESVIRHLYQSRGRAPSIEAYGAVSKVGNNSIRISVLLRPDEARFIKDYYSKTEICIVYRDGKLTPFMSPNNKNSAASALYPSDSPYEIEAIQVMRDISGYFRGHDGCISILPNDYCNIAAIVIKASIACDGVPLRTDYRMYLLDTTRQSSRFRVDDSSLRYEGIRNIIPNLYKQEAENCDYIEPSILEKALLGNNEIYNICSLNSNQM